MRWKLAAATAPDVAAPGGPCYPPRPLPRGAVAQFGRARESHSRGRRFDPGQLHHSPLKDDFEMRVSRRSVAGSNRRPISGGSGGAVRPPPEEPPSARAKRGAAGSIPVSSPSTSPSLARDLRPSAAPAGGSRTALDRRPDPLRSLQLPPRNSGTAGPGAGVVYCRGSAFGGRLARPDSRNSVARRAKAALSLDERHSPISSRRE